MSDLCEKKTFGRGADSRPIPSSHRLLRRELSRSDISVSVARVRIGTTTESRVGRAE